MSKYDKIYPQNITYNLSYKESLKIDGNLSRLAQVQVNWHSKSYKYDFNIALKKQIQLNLKNIDYAKLPTSDSHLSEGAFLENNVIIPIMYLNYNMLYILQHTKEIHIKKISKDSNITNIYFDAPIYENEKVVSTLRDSKIVFENNSGAIIHLTLKNAYQTSFSKEYSKGKNTEFETKTNHHILELRFRRRRDSKFQLSSFISKISADVKYNGKNENLIMDQKFLITGASVGRKTRKSKSIDLGKPFYENFAITEPNNSIILLSEEELAFIKDD